MINARARGTFGINDKGELYVIEKEGKVGYSEFYRDRLLQAIEKKDGNINISINESITYTNKVKNAAGKEITYTKSVNLDNPSLGGGGTIGDEGKDQNITVNGKDYNLPGGSTNWVKDVNGESLPQEAADVTMHELIGHGIPKLLGESKNKNAVEEENKARAQLKPGRNTQRAADPNHKANKNL